MVPVLAKILEKIIAAQLSNYLEQHTLLCPHQGAYCYGKSTEDVLLVAVDFITQCLHDGKAVCASFLDFRKAFDSLDHHMLLDKLFQLNIHPDVLKWFQNYLSNRWHRVKGGNGFSEWRSMKVGIPQGSALGPLLFLVYVNDLPSQVPGGILLQYADDTTLICSAPDPEEAAALMNSHLEVIGQWTINNRMQLNLSKSSVMWFRAPSQHVIPSPPGIFVNGIHLAVVCKQKYLGLIFDDTLSWSHHVSKVCQSMSYYLYLLNKQRLVFKTSLLKLLIERLVFSRLVYCLPVWGPPLTVTSINRLKCLQH